MIRFSELLSLSSPEFELPCDVRGCHLYEARGFRWLTSGPEAIQTAMCLENPASLVLPNHRAMMLATLLPESVSTVLDLGSGGGGFLRHIQSWVNAPRVSGVEMNGEMLHVAREHFVLPPEQLIHVTDAVDFLGRDRVRYDLVLCDLFSDRSAPSALQDELFFATLARRLEPGAAVAINTLPESAESLLRVVSAAQSHFDGLGIVQLSELGNVLLFLQEEPLPDDETLRRRLSQSAYASDSDVAVAIAGLKRLVTEVAGAEESKEERGPGA
ncbi:methyltransferase domain-containing protein [Congregibacter litoralis]|uniref:Spermidine synthase n=1 Tax=Congregibacter litoralis KT71 TaxID=314285 RepID=A4AC32_9GAMM|nr:methyltransferase domain-containing protein [Congregibacter litoralis]EAQ96482.1 Spermidine synthase [Congregibacter litoralis KT71]